MHIYEKMIGLTFSRVFLRDRDEIWFMLDEKNGFRFYHEQDCCEDVSVEDVCGFLADLEGSPLLEAEKVEQTHADTEWGTCTWTFYKFRTEKGSVTVRWYGESNGYYSEGVNYGEIRDGQRISSWELEYEDY